jgi:hypothetical protein
MKIFYSKFAVMQHKNFNTSFKCDLCMVNLYGISVKFSKIFCFRPHIEIFDVSNSNFSDVLTTFSILSYHDDVNKFYETSTVKEKKG